MFVDDCKCETGELRFFLYLRKVCRTKDSSLVLTLRLVVSIRSALRDDFEALITSHLRQRPLHSTY